MKNSETALGVLFAIAMAMGTVLAADVSYSFPRKGRFILPSSTAHEIFEQCSRSAPNAKSEIWTPSEEDIQELESLLPKYLEGRNKPHSETPPQGEYHRQYVGFIQNGERYIYGNFYQAESWTAGSESSHAVRVCDGGPSFWGIVFQVRTKTFQDIHFNGRA